MAHASGQPIIDPDDPADARRLWSELPIILTLAERAIEELLEVESSQTVFQKHLYELRGFKSLLGDEIVGCLQRGDDPPEERLVDIPDITVQIRRKAAYDALTGLTIKSMGREKHKLHLLFTSKDELTKFRIALDFENERLCFDVFNDVGQTDVGSAQSAEAMVDVIRFSNDLFGNGQLRIVNAETGILISRKDAFIPLNMYLDDKAANALVESWRAIAFWRQSLNERYAAALTQHHSTYQISYVQHDEDGLR